MNARLRCLPALGLLMAMAVSAVAQRASSLVRERGAVYVEDLGEGSVRLRVREAAPAFGDLRGQRVLGTLLPGQMVQLVAFSEKAARVRGRAAHGDIVGWVGLRFLEAGDDTLFDRLRQAAERNEQVQELIDRREAAIGMTPDEVIRALGRPDEETSDVRRHGSAGSFSYVTFDRVPQRNLVRDRFGRLVQTVTYIRVETGRLTVTFENGSVSGIQTTRGRPNWSNTRVVVPPIRIW